MRALKKIMAALALTAVLAGCSADNILSSIQGGKAGTVQTVSRPAVESAELQFTHPAAGDTIAVFDTSAGVFKAVLFSTEAPQAVQNFTTLAQQGFYNGLTVTRVEKPGRARTAKAPPSGTGTVSPPRPPISSTTIPAHSVRQRTPPATAPASSMSWRPCRAAVR